MASEVRRVGMRRGQGILLDPGQPVSVLIGEIDLWRLARRRPADEQRLSLLVHRRVVGESKVGEALGSTWSEIIERIDLPGEDVVLGPGEEQPMALLVDSGEALHHPWAAGELGPLAVGEAIEMTVAVTLGPPDEAAVIEEF